MAEIHTERRGWPDAKALVVATAVHLLLALAWLQGKPVLPSPVPPLALMTLVPEAAQLEALPPPAPVHVQKVEMTQAPASAPASAPVAKVPSTEPARQASADAPPVSAAQETTGPGARDSAPSPAGASTGAGIAGEAPKVVAASANATAASRSMTIGVVCSKQSKPQMPARAIRDGISAVVHAELHIRAGKVVEVRFLNGPPLFYEAIRKAVAQYECQALEAELIADQAFSFGFDD